jgi:hypothetical protein
MPDWPVKPQRQLQCVIGFAALVAPALHTVTDVMEWHDRGFTDTQLWLNFAAFLPMPLLLLGLHVVQVPRPGKAGLLGALLYGAAFVYFLYTTVYALAENVPDYEELWTRLGNTYTVFGGLMVCGGLLFGWSALRVGWLPRSAVLLFLSGIVVNLVLAVLPAPDILQTVGSAMRNFGLMGMGYAILFQSAPSGAASRTMRP